MGDNDNASPPPSVGLPRFSHFICAHYNLTERLTYFPVHAFASRNIRYPASLLSIIYSFISLVDTLSMAFTSPSHSAFGINGKDIVSCYFSPPGCNAALKMLWLQ